MSAAAEYEKALAEYRKKPGRTPDRLNQLGQQLADERRALRAGRPGVPTVGGDAEAS